MSDCSTHAYDVPDFSLKKMAAAQGGPPYMLEVDDMFDLLPESVTDLVTTVMWRGHVYVRAD
jgi:hypothetical protein